jgi:hypothetical protein
MNTAAIKPVVGHRYNWIGQRERLVYMGTKRYPAGWGLWHQFALVEKPDVVWCEVRPSDLDRFEPTAVDLSGIQLQTAA